MSRPSPSVSAQDYHDQIKKGNDDNMYVSSADKNNIYKWKKLVIKKNPYDHYMQYPEIYLNKHFFKYKVNSYVKKLDNIAKKLNKENIYFIFVGWNNVFDWIDNAWDEAKEIIYKKSKKRKDINTNDIFKNNFLFCTANNIFLAQNTGELAIQWNLSKSALNIVNNIMKNVFGRDYTPPKTIKKTLNLKIR